MLTLPASGFVSHETIRPARLKQTESSQGRVVLLGSLVTFPRAIGRLALSESELAHPAVTSEDDLVQRTDERK